jgi:hypothetical protein
VKRLTLPFVLAALLSAMFVTPALAAPPSNDTYAGRTVVGSIPYSDTVDTTEATTDADDAEWNVPCGAPATDASVWYELTPETDGPLLVDSAGSDYPVGFTIVTGEPGSFELVACGPDAVAFEAFAGETYSIIAFDDQFDGGGNGGTLVVTIDVAPPPPVVDVSVDPVAEFDAQTGVVTVTGTLTCSGGDFAFVDVQLEQRAGRFIIRGFGGIDAPCDGETHAWSVEVIGENGIFKGGRAVAFAFGIGCNSYTCGEDFEQVTLRLRG